MRTIYFEMDAGEKPVSSVPLLIKILLLISLLMQFAYHHMNDDLHPSSRSLPEAPAGNILNIASAGEPVVSAKILMLWLQGFDHQPGVSIPFRNLDYSRLTGWLDRIISLDPRSHYALLSAARIYSEVPDQNRRRQVLEFVYEKFIENPDERWPWLAHAVYMAKHRMQDRDLALKYARELRVRTSAEIVPEWARQLELFVYEDFGDVESARILLGGLIESGEITDQREIDFLTSRLGIPPDTDNSNLEVPEN
jgi:hypothetical protein